MTKPDSVLLELCKGPVDLGDKPLPQWRLEQLWITDRERLLSCARKHLALRDYYADRDQLLSELPGVRPAAALPRRAAK
nr:MULTISPECIES: anaerobic dehydrogenase [unclassified Rhizobium]